MAVSIHSKFKGKTFIANFVSNDDASTRNLLTNGLKLTHLPDSFPTPTSLTDLNYRIKCIAKPIFSLAATNKGISRVSRGDALRIKRNYAWYFKTQVKKKMASFKNLLMVLRHLFTIILVHHWCDGEWCWAKRLDDEEEAKMCQVKQPGEKQSVRTNNHAFKIIAQTGLIDETLCVFINDDENTDEDEI